MENYTEKRNGLNIEIVQDTDSESPEAWGDNGAFIVFYHRDFNVEGAKDKCGYHIITKEECIDYFLNGKKIDQAKEYHIFPLSALIHSGVHLYLGKEDHMADPGGWDSSFAGAVLVSKKEFRLSKSAYKYAEGLVQTWNDYLSGNVYGYNITDPAGNVIDSCYGFYGDYETGALLEARRSVDLRTHYGNTDHNGQLLFNFMKN